MREDSSSAKIPENAQKTKIHGRALTNAKKGFRLTLTAVGQLGYTLTFLLTTLSLYLY